MSCCGMVLSAVVRHDRWMTIIKINAIRVPRESGDELAHRFAARAGAVDDADGFQGYALLKPTDDRDQWLVITRWRDEESFQAWLGSESFTQGHPSAAERQGGATPKPVASHSEVWSYSSPVGLTSFWIGCKADRPELAEFFATILPFGPGCTRSTGAARHTPYWIGADCLTGYRASRMHSGSGGSDINTWYREAGRLLLAVERANACGCLRGRRFPAPRCQCAESRVST
jgi:heme oxygenase (mycobilin-producing)